MIIDGNIYLPSNDGHFISENQRRVTEILQDYDPNLEVQWIPPGQRSSQDYAFRVVDTNPRARSYVVCFAHECDERLLARVFQGDNTKGNVLDYLDKLETAKQALLMKAELEQRMEDHELAASVIRSNKIHYRHNGIDFGKPFGGRFG